MKKRTSDKAIGKSRLLLRVLLAMFAGMTFMRLVPQAFAEEPQEERWNAFGQATYIWQRKHAFPAAYTNLNGTPTHSCPTRSAVSRRR